MPRFGVMIQCTTDDGKIAMLLPQSQYLVYNNEMYSAEAYWALSFSTLVAFAKQDYTFTINLYYKNTITNNDEKIQTVRSFTLNIFKDGVELNRLFYGSCRPNFRGHPQDIYMILKYKHSLEFYDNRIVHWQCIQGFLRQQLKRWKTKRRLALAMALHERLGQHSLLNTIPPELFSRFF
jgi:hypothetical protein